MAVTVPITQFDDNSDEADIFSRVIRERRLAKQEPLGCDFIKRDHITHRKSIVKGKVLDYDP